MQATHAITFKHQTYIGLSTNLLQHCQFNIAAADDGSVQPGFRSLIGAKQESSERDCAAGLGDGCGISCQDFHCAANLVFADGDDVIDEFLHVREVNVADALGAQSISDGA